MKKILFWLSLSFIFLTQSLVSASAAEVLEPRDIDLRQQVDLKVEVIEDETTVGMLKLKWSIKNNSPHRLLFPKTYYVYLGRGLGKHKEKRNNFYWVSPYDAFDPKNIVIGRTHQIHGWLRGGRWKKAMMRYGRFPSSADIEVGVLNPKDEVSGTLSVNRVLEINHRHFAGYFFTGQADPEKQQKAFYEKLKELDKDFLCNVVFHIQLYPVLNEVDADKKIIKGFARKNHILSKPIDTCFDGITFSPEILPQNIPYMGANRYKAYYPEIIWRNKEVQKKWQGE